MLSSSLKKIFLISILSLTLSVGHSEDIDAMVNKAKATLKSGDAKKSAEMLNHILTGMKSEIRNHPRHAETWYLFSVSLDKLGRKELAGKALNRAKQLKQMQSEKKVEAENAEKQKDAAPDVQAPHQNKTSEPEKAADETPVNSAYSLASLKNKDAQNHYRKAAAYLEQNHLQAAAEEFIKACEFESNNVELLEKACATLDQAGGQYFLKAQKLNDQLEKINGDKMTAKQKAAMARANIYSSKPDLKKAEAILELLIKQDEKNAEAIVLSAQVDAENMKFKPAIEKFEKAIKLEPNNMPAYLGLGHCYVKMNQFALAIKTLSRARELWPDSFKPLVALGNAYLKNENLGHALQMFNNAFAINEKDFEVNLGLLEIYARSNDPRASLHLEICDKLFKGEPRVEFWKASFLELDGKILQAKKTYTWLAMYDDEISIRARLRLGQIYAGIGHTTFPGNLLVKDRPTFESNYSTLANYKNAFNYYSEALEKKPDLKEAQEIKVWLNENEEKVSASFQFDELIQSHFRQ